MDQLLMRRPKCRRALAIVAVWALGAPALAQEPAPAPDPAPPAEPPPTEPTPTEATPAPRAPKGRLRDPGTGPGFFAGLHVGPAFALSPLSASFLPRLEVGVELPVWQRRLRPFLTAAWSRPGAEGQAQDDRVDGEWSYDLAQDEWTLGGGLNVAILAPGSFPVIPEVGLGAEALILTSKITGEAAGSAFPESTEVYTRGGILALAGVRAPLGPGELTGHLTWHSGELNGLVTGDSTAMQLVPTVGYRLVF